MENKKSHIIVLTITVFVILFLLIVIIYGYLTHKDEFSIGNIILNAILLLWLGTYPIAFYTCIRIVCFEEKEYNGVISHLFYSFRGSRLSLIFVIPLLLSPFFIIQYIKLFRMDNESKKLKK